MVEIHNFELHYPYIAKKVVAYNDRGWGELLVKLEDGRFLLYDDVEHTIRYLPKDPDNLTKEECAREFGIRLQRMMDRRHVTQCDLSDITGIPQPLISHYTNGLTLPTFYNIDKIAKALNCSVDEFRYI